MYDPTVQNKYRVRRKVLTSVSDARHGGDYQGGPQPRPGREAFEAVGLWEFQPGMRNGKPVAVPVQAAGDFSLL